TSPRFPYTTLFRSSKTIKTEKDFTFDIVYRHNELDVTVKKTINAVYDGRVFPDKIEISDGNNQAGEFGKQLGKPLKVKVTDEDGKILEGVEVKWRIKSGSGTLNSTTSISDANGIAQASWT